MPSHLAVILIVDDEAVVREIVSRALQHENSEILTATSGPEALEMCRARTEPIHLAILDIVMPHMNGLQLLACLRSLFPKIRVLFMSGYLKDYALDIAGLLPEDGHFLAKPFTPAQIRSRVKEELDALPQAYIS